MHLLLHMKAVSSPQKVKIMQVKYQADQKAASSLLHQAIP
jgi:hypothetical protein